MSEITKKYTDGDLTVIWKPQKCIHSEKCYKGLPGVFKPSEKPWIDPSAENHDRIRVQIQKCPSGALSYKGMPSNSNPADGKSTKVELRPDGPIMIDAPVTIEKDGKSQVIDKGRVALCRCGASENKPFCDGTHRNVGFRG